MVDLGVSFRVAQGGRQKSGGRRQETGGRNHNAEGRKQKEESRVSKRQKAEGGEPVRRAEADCFELNPWSETRS
jgi:hypothetical protein